MKITFFFLLLFSTSFVSAQKASNYDYSFEPVLTKGKPYFHITIRYRSTGSESYFQLPKVWGSNPSDFLHLDTIIGAKKLPSEDEYMLKLKHKNSKPVEIRYRVYNAIRDSIPGRGEEYLPAITATYFSLFSNSVLFIPRNENPATHNFFIHWINYPESYRQLPITSFGRERSKSWSICAAWIYKTW